MMDQSALEYIIPQDIDTHRFLTMLCFTNCFYALRMSEFARVLEAVTYPLVFWSE